MATNKYVKSVSLSKDAILIIKNNLSTHGEFSKWVENKLNEEFYDDVNRLINKKRELVTRINLMDKQLEECKVNRFRDEEIEFLKDAKRRLDKNPLFINGILSQYYNIFHKKVSKERFYKLMSDAINIKK